MALNWLGPLTRRRGSALAHGCDRSGRVVLPPARAAAVSTGLRLQAEAHRAVRLRMVTGRPRLVQLRVGARARVRVWGWGWGWVGVGVVLVSGLDFGLRLRLG